MPMKVTVCFDKVKVLVPCGDGEFPVSELIDKAVVRYKKAIGKPSGYWVSVHTLRTVTEDSILDQDDTLCDVVDDREQLIADFEEQCGSRTHHSGGDGQSVSSAGPVSPGIFQSNVSSLKPQHQRGYSFDSQNDVIVTTLDISSGSGLTVRRGSEPTLIPLDGHSSSISSDKQNSSDHTCQDNKGPCNNNTHKPIIKISPVTQKEREKTPPFSRFTRDTWRQSLGSHPSMLKWFEAQEKQEEKFKQTEHQGPVGGVVSPEADGDNADQASATVKKEVGVLLCLKSDGTPLGIHVVPDFNEAGKESGLMIQSIEPGGRVDRDGRLKVHDRIIEINAHALLGISFPKAQEIFRNAMKTDEVRLKVVKHSVPQLPKKLPPSVLPKPKGHSPTKPSPLTLPQNLEVHSPQLSPNETSSPLDRPDVVQGESKISFDLHSLPQCSTSINTGLTNTISIKPAPPPPRKAPPVPPARHPSTTLSSGPSFSETNINTSTKLTTPSGTLTKSREIIIAPTNTKKIGKRVEIDLMKGPAGLGFSVTTRDNPTGGDSPIYIKNILPQGAAVTDGRLKAGDRLLEVNGVEMTGKSQSDAVSILRNAALGSTVKIVVSRQEVDKEEEVEEQDDRFKVPREMPGSNTDDLDLSSNDLHTKIFQPPEKTGDDGNVALMKNKELLEFNILLNDTGSAGLGVSVKGKTLTTEQGTHDLGIFVKAVIHGGAASKDGRLQVNDKLLEVNQVSLINHANTEAMELLRNAMQLEGPVPGSINIKVARKIAAPYPHPFSSYGYGEHDCGGVMVTNEMELNNNDSLDNTDQVADGKVEEKSSLKIKGGDGANNFSSPNISPDTVRCGNGLRNKSYNKATHDSSFDSPDSKRDQNSIDLSKQQPRPHSTLGIARGSLGGSNSSSSEEDLNKEPAWIHGPDWSRHASQTSEESELSPARDGFSRDGFGRQSMSEKRKGHMDPRSSEIFQKVKGRKENHKGAQRANQQLEPYGHLVRAGSAESILSRSNSNINNQWTLTHDKYVSNRGPAPPSNLKRFSSLENLTTMHDADVSTSYEEDDESPHPTMARRRGGNESFRAAVDRSYDPVPHLDMDPYEGKEARSSQLQRRNSVEEENSEEGSLNSDHTNSARSSVSDSVVSDDLKKKGTKKVKVNKKSGGLLKGFILKLGKGRKTPSDDIGKLSSSSSQSEVKKDFVDVEGGTHQEHLQADEQKWRQAHVDQERVQEQIRRLQEQQQQQCNINNQQYSFNPFPLEFVIPQNMVNSGPVSSGAEFNRDQPISRAERIQQLRADHQRRHQDRQGHYPQEEKEEQYEKMIQEEEKRGTRFTKDDYFFYQKYGQSAIPIQIGQQSQTPRLASQNQAERSDSRLGQEEFTKGPFIDKTISQPGARSVSDTNVLKYNNYFRPPSRGQIGFNEQSFPQSHSFQTVQQQPQYMQQDPTPSGERHYQQQFNVPHSPTPTNENISNHYRNLSDNYPSVQKENTPSNIIVSDNWNYVQNDASRMNTGNKQVNAKRNHVTRPEILPPSDGGSYGNAAYNDHVYTAMTAKRPVKTLTQQPNSAKV